VVHLEGHFISFQIPLNQLALNIMKLGKKQKIGTTPNHHFQKMRGKSVTLRGQFRQSLISSKGSNAIILYFKQSFNNIKTYKQKLQLCFNYFAKHAI